MEQFLTSEIEEKFKKITLDYTYENKMLIHDKIKRKTFSTSLKNHYLILKEMMEQESISYDYEAWNYLMDIDIFFAARRMAELGDMIMHISLHPEKPSEPEFYICYAPFHLQEFQRYRLRLWHEFYMKYKKEYKIQGPTGEKTFAYEWNEVPKFLEEQQILDDDYIRTLTKKYPIEDHL